MDRSVTFTLTRKDYLAAQDLQFWKSLINWRTVRNSIVVGLFFIALEVGISTQDGSWSHLTSMSRIEIIAGLAALAPVYAVGICLLLHYTLFRWRYIRLFKENKLFHNEVTVSWSEQGYSTRAVYGQSTIPWNDFLYWRADKKTILFYPSRSMYYLTPRRVFSSEQFADLENCITTPRKN